MAALLEVKDLKVQFSTLEGVVHAVNGVSFSVDEGKTLGIVGESGCGKSVTMLSVMRLIPEPPGRIVAGEVLFKNRNLFKLDKPAIQNLRGAEIAMVFQDPMTSLNPVLTIGQQISEALMVHEGMTKPGAVGRTLELLDLVGIPQAKERYNDFPHQFSGGMRQRVMIAMGLSCNPSILIADEPTTALDVTIQAQIVELTKKIQSHLGMSIIWITHDLGIVAEIADRVIVMYAGYIVEEADVYSIFENPVHPYTLSLQRSLPRVDSKRYERLSIIQGSPPDCIHLPRGCPFGPRCEYAIERCLQENPVLDAVGEGHRAACWVDARKRRAR
ncbi:MAG: ABC transporter ATP-binding protein [Chloroflexi bacterium]|nr:ABC transporter ATP-binding protein [Chloroflexota bacterium]